MAIPVTRSRWVRKLIAKPGDWKRQLPTKHLRLAARGRLDEVRSLVEHNPSLLNKRGSHGRTFLWTAVRYGQAEVMSWLLEQGADVNLTGCINSESFVQLSPLAASTFYNRAGYDKPLQAYGAIDDIFRSTLQGRTDVVLNQLDHSPELLFAEDPEDRIYHSPLLAFALVGGHLDLATAFIQRGFPVTDYSFQLLFIACHFGHSQFVDKLIANGADVSDSDASLWMTTNDTALLKKLIQHGLSANQRPNGDLTPLLYACRADKGTNLEKIQLLLELGANVNSTSADGRTALHYVATSNNYEACKLLLEAGVDPLCRTHKGQLASELAAQKGHDLIESLIKSYAS